MFEINLRILGNETKDWALSFELSFMLIVIYNNVGTDVDLCSSLSSWCYNAKKCMSL